MWAWVSQKDWVELDFWNSRKQHKWNAHLSRVKRRRNRWTRKPKLNSHPKHHQLSNPRSQRYKRKPQICQTLSSPPLVQLHETRTNKIHAWNCPSKFPTNHLSEQSNQRHQSGLGQTNLSKLRNADAVWKRNPTWWS